MITTRILVERGTRRRICSIMLMMAAGSIAGCGLDRPTVPNYNNPTPTGLAGDPVGGVQLSANGLVFQLRAQVAGFISGAGIMGRESFNYTPTEGRNTTCWLQKMDYACGGGASFWAGFYTESKDVSSFLATIEATGGLSTAQKEGARGFAKTLEAYSLAFVAERGKFGGPTSISDDPRVLTPFVSRDSMYNYIIGRLDEAKTSLNAAGASFAFALNSGFTGFNSPATFLQFNRALAARFNAERASLRNAACGANGTTCYQLVLQNLTDAGSFVDGTNLQKGPQWVYSTASGDATNGLSKASSAFIFAHPSIKTDAPLRSDGSPDLRYQAKLVTLTQPVGTGSAVPGIQTDQDFKIYPTQSTSIPMIRSEELILLRAEAEWFTGAKAAAITDINTIRTTSGGLAASTLTTAGTDDQFIAELLLQRRYSLLFEGHRWIDVRRLGKLTTLPIDIPASQVLYDDLVIPQTECLARAGAPANLAAPSCP
ncbi:MAG TPA: RagB/SusD family nutrient uptake outer membrane protein [Gemmatimonadaceae bacterium]|nr:RagB/SusD family nutrient uptake outer membrane protein [Gemmatimonadaceae bacterium]